MVEPDGRFWLQPTPAAITIDDTHALMDLETFYRLPEYSGSLPSGVYTGKMWKRHEGLFDPNCGARYWRLCWYVINAERPDVADIHFRTILEPEL